jgi:hypothetical protein
MVYFNNNADKITFIELIWYTYILLNKNNPIDWMEKRQVDQIF